MYKSAYAAIHGHASAMAEMQDNLIGVPMRWTCWPPWTWTAAVHSLHQEVDLLPTWVGSGSGSSPTRHGWPISSIHPDESFPCFQQDLFLLVSEFACHKTKASYGRFGILDLVLDPLGRGG